MDYKEKLEIAKSLSRIELFLSNIVELLTSKKVSSDIRTYIYNAVNVAFEEENEKIKKEYENE